MKNLIVLVASLAVLCSAGLSMAAVPVPQLCYSTDGLEVTASWSTVPGATAYTLYYAPFPFEGPDTIGSVDMAGAKTISVELWEGAEFYIAVTALNGLEESEYSNIELFKTTAVSASSSLITCQPIENGIQIVFPSMSPISDVIIEEYENPPPPPDGFVLGGKVYEVSVPDSVPFPAKVSIPASDELLADAENKQFVIGRYNGHSWDLIPAALIDDSIVADVDHFSLVAIFWRAREMPAEYTTAFLQSLTVSPPDFDWMIVRNNEIFAVLDLGKSRNAYNNTGEIVPLLVNKWELSVLTPNVTTGKPEIRTDTFVPILFNGEPFIHIPIPYGIGLTLVSFKIEINLTNLFDFSTIVNLLNDHSRPEDYGSFVFRIRPIFDETNTYGSLSSFEYLPVGVADAQIRLTQGLTDRLNADQKDDFIRRVSSTPYLLPYNKGWDEVYANPLSWRNTAYLGIRGVYHPLIGIKNSTEWVRVISHEWGHYASHMLMGDEWTNRVATGSHEGWKEANSRELAWAEDLGTFLGQWGVNSRSNSLPEQSGAMAGDLTDYSTFDADPRNVTEGGSPNDYWPINLDMDAIKVEAVPATILSRLSSKYSFADVMEIILSSHPINLTEFINQWFEHYGMDSSESEFLQTICVDEGVTWVLNGHIEEESSANPLQGVSVYVNGVNSNLQLSPEGHSDISGDFKINVPPGDVNIKFVKSGYESMDDLTITANVNFETNVGFLDGEVKLYVGRTGVIDRDYEPLGPAGSFRMQVDQNCDGIYEVCSINYTDNGNGTVTDNAGLIWQQSDDDVRRNWQESIDYCSALSLGGSSAWRLPTIDELEGLVDKAYVPSIDPVFTGTESEFYWSSTSYASGSASAWTVSFLSGHASIGRKSNDGYSDTPFLYYARCVR